ncbi:Rv3235 family protein [Gordonia soli]|uniref:Uncharacterized protein n=1 Tax=Gordonia soli NBRC 108243 TaxID=1223545 RepID=M0QDQ1_9ACTN|nr:Rv3235 family protein [Gordonia soli]GAC66728.1 hypothetical protein GS4_03_01760 [Gordonia soli NBRC 108243]
METPRVLIRPAPPYEHESLVPDIDGRAPAVVGPPRPTDLALPARPVYPSASAVAAAHVDARRFAMRAVTLIGEALDHRRGVGQLDSVLAPALRDQLGLMVRTGSTRPPGADSASTVRRVHIQMCGRECAEIFGSYSRAGRVQAFAGRVERLACRVRPTPVAGTARYAGSTVVENQWRVTAFSLR